MNPAEMREILSLAEYPGYEFEVLQLDCGELFLRAKYLQADIITGKSEEQHTRKWLLSRYAVSSEIVQTALKCVLTSLEHEAREHFLYRGERVYGPHYDVEALYELCRAKKLDYKR